MKIQWLGHNCFCLTSRRGSTVLTDPYSQSVQIEFPPITADIVVMSHEHPENNAAWRVGGSPLIVKRTSQFPCEHELNVTRTKEFFVIKGIPTHHDDVLGRRRGPNTIFSWSMDKIRCCFLGDLGHVLEDKQAASLIPVDLLFIPVGGRGYTLGPNEATVVVDQLHPSLIIPMTYKHPAVSWDLEPLSAFLARMSQVFHLPGDTYEFTSAQKPASVLVFQLSGESRTVADSSGTDDHPPEADGARHF